MVCSGNVVIHRQHAMHDDTISYDLTLRISGQNERVAGILIRLHALVMFCVSFLLQQNN